MDGGWRNVLRLRREGRRMARRVGGSRHSGLHRLDGDVGNVRALDGEAR